MSEPDVTLTDFALAVECAVFAALALRWPANDPRMRRSWVILFASSRSERCSAASCTGFCRTSARQRTALLWATTLLCVGMSSTAMWMIGSYMELSEPSGTRVRHAALGFLTLYAIVVLFVTTRFVVAIAAYLPATVFLLIAFARSYSRSREPAQAYGVLGLGLTFVAAGVQQMRIAIHPTYFNHNALYHVIQGIRVVSRVSRRQIRHTGAGVTADVTRSNRT